MIIQMQNKGGFMRWIMKDGGLNSVIVEANAKLMLDKLMDKKNNLNFMLEHVAGKFFILAARNGPSFDFYAFNQYEWSLLPDHIVSIFLGLKPREISLEAPPKKKIESWRGSSI